MSIVSRKLVGFSVLIILSVGLAAAFLVLWPRPMSMMLAGVSQLCCFGALLVLCTAAGREYALQAQRAIFLTSGCFGLAFMGPSLEISRACARLLLGFTHCCGHAVLRSARDFLDYAIN